MNTAARSCAAIGVLLGVVMVGHTLGQRAGDGKVDIASEDGNVFVVKAGPAYALLATNRMGDVCMASPALSKRIIYVRTKSQLVAVAAAR
jgi:outer membrane protein assembly factor BamB